MHPDHPHDAPVQRAVEVHQPTPLLPVVAAPAPVVPVQPGHVPAVASIVLPDGRVVTGYAIEPAHPEPATAPTPVSRTAVNLALTGVGFAGLCGGLALAAGFITALAALIHQVMICAAVIFGGYLAVRILGTGRNESGTTVNIRKAVIKRNHFHG